MGKGKKGDHSFLSLSAAGAGSHSIAVGAKPRRMARLLVVGCWSGLATVDRGLAVVIFYHHFDFLLKLLFRLQKYMTIEMTIEIQNRNTESK